VNLAEFYDHVVLRDLLEYTAPGVVVMAGGPAAVDIASFALGFDFPVMHFATAHPWQGLVSLLFFGYLTGHILTAVQFRGPETNLESETLKDNAWFTSHVSSAIAARLSIRRPKRSNS
jgi:hypothetical protein